MPGSSARGISDYSPYVVLGTTLLGTFLGAFNNSVASVALPNVLADFPSIGVTTGAWFITIYMLATAVFLPVAGRLIDFHGARRIYIGATWLFGAASLLCAVAPSFPWVLVGRTAQGITGAPVLPVVFLTVTKAFSSGRRGRAMGIWASANAASLTLGPLLGGLIVGTLGWRAIFWVDVALAAGVVAVAHRYLADYGRTARGSFDSLGAVMFTTGLVSLMVLLSQSGRGTSRPWFWILLVLTLTLGAFYVLRSLNLKNPFFNLRLFQNRIYSLVNGVVALQMATLFGLFFAIPLLLIQGLGATHELAGVVLSLVTLTAMLLAPLTGHLGERFGTGRLLAFGGGFLSAGAVVILLEGGSVVWVALGLVVIGVGMAAIQSPAALAVTVSLKGEWSGVAIGAYNTVRFLSGVAGATVFAMLLETAGGVPASQGIARVRPEVLVSGLRVVFWGMIVCGVSVMVLASRISGRLVWGGR